MVWLSGTEAKYRKKPMNQFTADQRSGDFPAMSAMRLYDSFFKVTVCSAVLSVGCAIAGIVISILASTPVGSTIVAIDVLAFALCCLK